MSFPAVISSQKCCKVMVWEMVEDGFLELVVVVGTPGGVGGRGFGYVGRSINHPRGAPKWHNNNNNTNKERVFNAVEDERHYVS